MIAWPTNNHFCIFLKGPMTNAEKNRAYIQRLKEDNKYEAYKRRHARQEKERRDRKKQTLKQLPPELERTINTRRRQMDNERARRFRERKKQALQKENSSSSGEKNGNFEVSALRSTSNYILPRMFKCILYKL